MHQPNRTRIFDAEFIREALKKWHTQYGQLSEVAVNLITAVVVVIFISYQALTLLSSRTTRPVRLTKEEMKKRTERNDKCVGSEEHLIEHHKHVSSVGRVPLHVTVLDDEESLRASQFFYERMKVRRSVRQFSTRPVPMKALINVIKTAGTAPSAFGAQPWIFCVILREDLRMCVRQIVEDEHRKNYMKSVGIDNAEDVSFLDSAWSRPYLSDAPCLIAVCHSVYNDNERALDLNEASTSIAVGLLLAALQLAGLHTVVTSPLTAGPLLSRILQRPLNERLLLLLPVGYPIDDITVPDLTRKPLESIVKLY